MIKKSFGQKDFEVLQQDVCFQGFFKLIKYHFRHRRFDGSWSNDVAREIFVRGNATCVLPYDPKTESVVLIEQFRAGGLLHTESPWMFELIAGINEEGESPLDVAKREAQEEANAELLELRHIQDFFPSPGGSTERISLFCAKVDSSELGGVYGLPEEDEDIMVHVLSLAEALKCLSMGQIDNSPAIIALQWLRLNKDELDAAWGANAET
jgi:ADP-ribose pyrophosphatase